MFFVSGVRNNVLETILLRLCYVKRIDLFKYGPMMFPLSVNK